MSYISEKVAYLDGLADGIGLEDDKHGKLLRGIIDALGAIAEELEEQNEAYDDLSDCVDEIYEELDAIDCELYGDDEDADGGFMEIVCPSCGETIYFAEDMLDSEDGLICPACNEPVDIQIGCGGCEDKEPED